ncbi:MAG: methyltransferase domain-containing protein [Acidobacteria bacterium]|nr:methyltransferase domain-containing protein [Acidobacteriota bacterium]
MHKTPEEIYRTRRQFFNDHAEAWLDMWYRNPDTGEYDRHRENFKRLFSLVPLEPGDRVLDAGCGSGVLVPMILERIGATGLLYEVDFAEKMIEVNRKLHDADNVRFIVSDVARAPLDSASCDVVLCFACFPHLQDKEKTLKSLAGLLKKGGTLAVVHFESSDGINRHHESCSAVAHDYLPGREEMLSLFESAALKVDLFIDEPGFYCVRATK